MSPGFDLLSFHRAVWQAPGLNAHTIHNHRQALQEVVYRLFSFYGSCGFLMTLIVLQNPCRIKAGLVCDRGQEACAAPRPGMYKWYKAWTPAHIFPAIWLRGVTGWESQLSHTEWQPSWNVIRSFQEPCTQLFTAVSGVSANLSLKAKVHTEYVGSRPYTGLWSLRWVLKGT